MKLESINTDFIKMRKEQEKIQRLASGNPSNLNNANNANSQKQNEFTEVKAKKQ